MNTKKQLGNSNRQMTLKFYTISLQASTLTGIMMGKTKNSKCSATLTVRSMFIGLEIQDFGVFTITKYFLLAGAVLSI